MTGYKLNRNNRYQCIFCNYPAYKRMGDCLLHVNKKHALELAEASREELRAELQRERNKPPKIEIREKIVYKSKPDPKYWYVRDHGIEGIYCTACKQVQTGVGIPYGQTIENTPHHCGNRTLLPVVEVK